MVQFISLVSGSSGNASLLSDGSTALLIDCGLSGIRLKEKLNALGISPEDISAILITHEHTDHTKGVGIAARKYKIPIYSTYETLCAMSVGKIDEELLHPICQDKSFYIEDIKINPFGIPHDAASPVGYSFTVNNKKYTVATDIGYMPDSLYEKLDGSDSIILESNHDVEMLQYGPYPLYLKKRILGKTGHMSNELTAETALRLAKSGTKRIMLAHLSNENNTPDIARITTENALTAAGFNDVDLSVANRYETTAFAI